MKVLLTETEHCAKDSVFKRTLFVFEINSQIKIIDFGRTPALIEMSFIVIWENLLQWLCKLKLFLTSTFEFRFMKGDLEID